MLGEFAKSSSLGLEKGKGVLEILDSEETLNKCVLFRGARINFHSIKFHSKFDFELYCKQIFIPYTFIPSHLYEPFETYILY